MIYQTRQHLSDRDLLPEDRACPFCASQAERPPVLMVQENPRVDLLACKCGCISASRMPKPEYLRDYYHRYYSNELSEAKSSFRFPVNFEGSHRLARHLFRHLGVPAKQRIRILDFGGGRDAAVSRALARHFLDRGTARVEIALVDYNASVLESDAAVAVNSHLDLESAGGEFDIAIASAIVEHIPNPRETVRGLLNSLAPAGRAYFRTPAMTPVIKFAARLGTHVEFTYPAHLHDMGQAFWENVLSTMSGDGFTLLRSRPGLVEADFRTHPGRAGVSLLFKSPWFLLRRRYKMVGAWEAIIGRDPGATSRHNVTYGPRTAGKDQETVTGMDPTPRTLCSRS